MSRGSDARARAPEADGLVDPIGTDDEALVDAVMTASRALLATVARSLVGVHEDVTLPQYRALVVLAQRGTRRPVDLASALAVTPSTATRMCDRLVSKGLIVRDRADGDRRQVTVSLSGTGRDLVRDVTIRRRAELRELLGPIPEARRSELIEVLRSFSDAAGELPEAEWAIDGILR